MTGKPEMLCKPDEIPRFEQALPADISDDDLADSFRTQSFHLMQAHPIAAAHLVLAAASIAPTCHAEQGVADQFSYVIVDFAQRLAVLHRRSASRRAQDVTGSAHGH